MRVAYLTSWYPAISHTFIAREIEAVRGMGVEVHTFSIHRQRPEELLDDRDREASRRTFAILPTGPVRLVVSHLHMLLIHRCRYLRALWSAWRCRSPGLRAALWQVFYFGEAGILASELRRRGIRHIHAHFANVAASVAMLASEMAGGSWSMTLHGLGDFGNPAALLLPEKIRRANLVICVSDFGRAQAMLYSEPEAWHKIHRVHCGIDVQSFVLRNQAEAQTDSQPLRLLNVARLGPEKGHVILLRAVQCVVRQGIDVRCTLVGDGRERDRLERLMQELGITDHVHFVGTVAQDCLHTYYEQSDAFALSSFAEGLPVVLMEAMASGLPVIASHVMGVPELVEHGVSGLLVPPGRIEPLADAISQLARDPGLRHRMGAEGRECIVRRFDIRGSGQNLAQHFAGLPSRPEVT